MLDAKVHHTLPRKVSASDYDLGNGHYGLTQLSLGAHIGIKLDSKEAKARYASEETPLTRRAEARIARRDSVAPNAEVADSSDATSRSDDAISTDDTEAPPRRGAPSFFLT